MNIFVVCYFISVKPTLSSQLPVSLLAPHPNAFPGHQPETDSPGLKNIYNSWETTTRAGYVDPRIRQNPLGSTPASQK